MDRICFDLQVTRRQGVHAADMLGSVQDAHFDGMRRELLTRLEASVTGVMQAYDRENELDLLSSAVKNSLIHTAALQAGAATAGHISL